MGRGPKAGYRGGALQSCQPAAIDETPGRLINSRAATTQNAQKPTPTRARGAVPRRNGRYAGRIRLEVVPDRSAKSLVGFVEAAVEPGAQVVTDAWGAYNTLTEKGYRHVPVAMSGNPAMPDDHLPLVHIAFGNRWRVPLSRGTQTSIHN
jgi:hypothetical protein